MMPDPGVDSELESLCNWQSKVHVAGAEESLSEETSEDETYKSTESEGWGAKINSRRRSG